MEAAWIIPIVLVLLIVVGLLAVWRKGTKVTMDRYDGDVEAAMSDDESSIPSTPFIPDPATALGDTPEAHAEIDPHDIPIDSPARQAAEEQAAQDGRFARRSDRDRTTQR